ncbi:MAG: sigma-70 family RNA polymerase sigma factor [Nannocystaceae bacterium]|nr:sigma-70 family RNA polymerase sigma factor [bacterium]
MNTIAAALDSRWSEVSETWPQLSVSAAALAAELEARGWSADDLESLHIPDLALALACMSGDPDGLRVFEDAVLGNAEGAIRSIDASASFVDEVKQRTRVKLLVADGRADPRIRDYAGRGRLAAWVCVAAVRTALTLLRESNRANRFAEDRWARALAVPEVGDAELDYLKETYRQQFTASLQEALGGLDKRAKTVLRMYFAQGLSIDEIGTVYGVHRATIARWIGKYRGELYERTLGVLETTLGVPKSELSSLHRLVRSQLEVSFGALAAPQGSSQSQTKSGSSSQSQ